MKTKNWMVALLLFMIASLMFSAFHIPIVHGETYLLKANVDNSLNYEEGFPAQLNVSANFAAGQCFFFNFSKGRWWGNPFDQQYGLEPADQNFAPGTAIPPYKMVEFQIYTPSGDVVVSFVYVVAGVEPFAVVYLNQSADFVPLSDGNLTFANVGMEGTVERAGSYTVKAFDIAPYVQMNATTWYNMSEDPPLTMALYNVITSVTFAETGLPSGLTWWVDLNGDNQSSTSTTITFNEPNGTYPYSTSAAGYNASMPTGEATLKGTDISIQETFTILPEFPSTTLLPLFIIATLLTGIIYTRKHPASSKRQNEAHPEEH
jgi:hypothetical protein